MNQLRFLAIIAVLVFVLIAAPVSAHTGSANTMIGGSMMGSTPFTIMEELEEQMMGAQSHEEMEEFMEMMLKGELSSADQQAMIRLMQDERVGPGAMTMMMRMMSPPSSRALSMPFGMHGGYSIFSPFIFWITILLIWAVLVLAIVSLIKWLQKK